MGYGAQASKSTLHEMCVIPVQRGKKAKALNKIRTSGHAWHLCALREDVECGKSDAEALEVKTLVAM